MQQRLTNVTPSTFLTTEQKITLYTALVPPRHHHRRDSPSPLIRNSNSEHSTHLCPKSGRVCAGFQPHSDDKKKVAFSEQPPMPVPKRQHGIELRFHSGFLQHLPRRRVWKVLTGINQTFVKSAHMNQQNSSTVCVGVSGHDMSLCVCSVCGFDDR